MFHDYLYSRWKSLPSGTSFPFALSSKPSSSLLSVSQQSTLNTSSISLWQNLARFSHSANPWGPLMSQEPRGYNKINMIPALMSLVIQNRKQSFSQITKHRSRARHWASLEGTQHWWWLAAPPIQGWCCMVVEGGPEVNNQTDTNFFAVIINNCKGKLIWQWLAERCHLV